MHWALVAHKDQKDINLSSLRMLLVADGSNPCKFGEAGTLEDKVSWEVGKVGQFTGIEQDGSNFTRSAQ